MRSRARYPAAVKWAMTRDNGWLVWDRAKFRTLARAEVFRGFLKQQPRARMVTLEAKE